MLFVLCKKIYYYYKALIPSILHLIPENAYL
jgi:hypothetical protein